uniref:Si:ch73-379j16.2 n=1 Tax=Gouania willdenowi TaxID=441366 RepID=A0A8C5G2H6_GOUWI
MDVNTLTSRRLRIVPGPNHALFQLNQNNGLLSVGTNIDREELCDGTKVCLINLKIVVENPLEIHHVGVEISDVNDHSPAFPESAQRLEIAENTPPGTRFQVHAARDPDFGVQSVKTYKLNTNDIFDIEIRDSEEDKIPFLVLKKPLDREKKAEHCLVLTAADGGSPPKSGTLHLNITVLDVNDNRPMFSKDVYTVSLDENAPIGTLVLQINATDLDEGMNSEIEYSFGKTQRKKVHDIFDLDRVTGEITVKGSVDFEETEIYKLDIKVSDKGQPPTMTESRVIIKIKDVNDNKPEIEATSLSNKIPENTKPGTIIALISVTDRDSGVNGKVICKVSDHVPFDLRPSIEENMYSLITKGLLDRETLSHYDLIITATDCGEPQLQSVKTLSVQVSDVNDNKPSFSQNPQELYLTENNTPGAAIFSVSAADEDLNENSVINYHLLRGDGSFDFEAVKTFQFQVVATDSGTPSLSSNVTVHVFILDQNDNAPVILYPVSSNGSAEGVDHSLFGLDRYTGQIRTLRSFTETDEAEHKLLILVKDNGNVSLSATATVMVKQMHFANKGSVFVESARYFKMKTVFFPLLLLTAKRLSVFFENCYTKPTYYHYLQGSRYCIYNLFLFGNIKLNEISHL